jgi:regulator of sigma E protease
MLDLIQTIFAFILTIGLLVTVHEFGHYWVARRCGVKILRFSVGFGKPLWLRRFGPDQTEFVIAAVPLGGYVKMLGEAGEEVPAEDLPRAFDRQPLRARAAIVVAGPAFNFVFAIAAYGLMYMVGVPGLKPMIGEITPGGLADQAGLRAGQEIVAVNGQPTPRWESVLQATLQGRLDQARVQYQVVERQSVPREVSLDLSGLSVDDFSQAGLLDKLGMARAQPRLPAEIGEVVADTPAARAGLLAGDKIVALDEQAIGDWGEVLKYIGQRPGQTIQVTVERAGGRLVFAVVPVDDQGQGRIGIKVAQPEIWPPAEYSTIERYGPLDALWQGMSKTWEMSVLSLRMLGRMLLLEVSPKNISGPLSIAEYAGKTFSFGLSSFLWFLGLVSLSLGIINLLPIPVLDGGHLLLYLLEWIKGKPLSEQAVGLLQGIGMTLLLMLMGLAIFNDINRIWG